MEVYLQKKVSLLEYKSLYACSKILTVSPFPFLNGSFRVNTQAFYAKILFLSGSFVLYFSMCFQY